MGEGGFGLWASLGLLTARRNQPTMERRNGGAEAVKKTVFTSFGDRVTGSRAKVWAGFVLQLGFYNRQVELPRARP